MEELTINTYKVVVDNYPYGVEDFVNMVEKRYQSRTNELFDDVKIKPGSNEVRTIIYVTCSDQDILQDAVYDIIDWDSTVDAYVYSNYKE